VSGKYTAHDLSKMAKAHGGKAMLKTVEGGSITVAKHDGKWTVTDDKGNVANITIADVTQSNGEIFVIDKVLMP
ncbi:MAG: fasciclin domain-containing protein, partial [Rhodanobacter sp.]